MTKMMRAWIAGLLLAGATSLPASPLPATPQPAPGATDAAFKALYTAEWNWRQNEFAEEEDEGEGIAPHLPDVSPAAQQRKQAYLEHVAAQLGGIDPAALSPAAQVDYAVYKAQIDALIASLRFRDYEKPLTADSAFWSDMAGTARRSFRTIDDYRNYLSQLGEYPRYFTQQIDNMRAGLKRGFTPPRVTLQGRDASVASVADPAGAEDNPYYAPFKAMPASIPAPVQADLRAAGVKAVRDAVVPAHRALLAFLRDDYIPGSQPSIAAYDLPDGKAYYQAKIVEFTTLDLTPGQIHQTGLDEVAKIRAQMTDIMGEVKFDGDLPAFLHHLRTDPRFYAKTPQDLLDRAAWIAKTFDGKAKDWFGRLPRSRFAIVPVPADIAPFYTSGRGGPGVYLVNTYNLPARPLYSLTALTLHESAPGHAFQMPLAAENADLPAFRQKTYISAFGEGWALYSEKLGVEMGMYETPYDRFGMLSYQMWWAARLVVDTGVHAMGWSRDQARQYLHDNTALADHEIATEVDRYISWPGQALSYYLGELAIEAARARAEEALGPKFDIRAFHDTVLQLGSVPLPVMSARIDRFIAEGGPNPYPAED